jgi:hypothetical protein
MWYCPLPDKPKERRMKQTYLLGRIKQAMADRDIRQGELGRLMSTSESNISQILRRDMDWRVSTIFAIEEALSIELFNYKD